MASDYVRELVMISLAFPDEVKEWRACRRHLAEVWFKPIHHNKRHRAYALDAARFQLFLAVVDLNNAIYKDDRFRGGQVNKRMAYAYNSLYAMLQRVCREAGIEPRRR